MLSDSLLHCSDNFIQHTYFVRVYPFLKQIFYPGKGFCLDLAKKGMNIVLVSRSKDKLDTVAKEIEEKYSVKTKVIAVDFTKDKDVRESIEAGIKVSFCSFYLKSIIISQLL